MRNSNFGRGTFEREMKCKKDILDVDKWLPLPRKYRTWLICIINYRKGILGFPFLYEKIMLFFNMDRNRFLEIYLYLYKMIF